MKLNQNISGDSLNRIEKTTVFEGEIRSDGDFRVDGTFDGEIQTKGRIIVGSSGKVKGTIRSSFLDVEGKVDGKVFVTNTLTLKSTAVLSGEVIIEKLVVEPEAIFNAKCTMKKTEEIKNMAQKKKNILAESVKTKK